jgi:hypothetical protein
MELNKNKKSTKLRIYLLDIFPSLEDLNNQNKSDLSIIFHGINMFYDLEELISQRKEIIITPNQTQIKIIMSIVKSTDVLASGHMLIKHGTQWVTFLYENKEKSAPGNLALNLIDCIKINISCEILNNQNSQKKRNNSIEYPERKDIINKINKKTNENFQKITKKMNLNLNKKNHNNSQEHCNSEFIENYANANANTTNKKTASIDYNTDNQVLTSINREHNKKYDINNASNNLNNSINCIHKQYSNNNFCSLKKLKSQKNANNKKLKKRVNNSTMNMSGIESKTLTYKNSSKPKVDKEENNILSSTLKNFNNINRKNIKKYISSTDNENNPNFQNYAINIDELLSNKITEHINVMDKNYKNNNGLIGINIKHRYKKINNNNSKINNSTSQNKITHSKTKTSNFINVNVNVNASELNKQKNDNKKFKKSKNRFNTNSNLGNKYLTNNNSILNNNKTKNNFDLEISTNSIIDENDKKIVKEKKDDTISTKKNKKKTFSHESIAEHNAVSTNKINKTQYTIERTITDKSSEQIINESESESEDELNNYNKLKEDFMLLYNDEYIKNIQEDLLKLEVELFIEKISELIKEYHAQVEMKTMEHEILNNTYKKNVKNYIYQWKLYNRLQYIKIYHKSKIENPFEDKKKTDKNNNTKISINKKEMILFETLFSNNKDKDKDEKNNILKNVILNALRNKDKNILEIFKNDKSKNWIQQNISNFLK